MQKILSLLITGSKIGALLCFSAMGTLASPVAAEFIPSCHQTQQTDESQNEGVLTSNDDCNACEISQNVWENPLVQFPSDFVAKVLKQIDSSECPFQNVHTDYKDSTNRVATNDPPDRTNYLCQQLKMKNSVQLRL